MSVVFIITGKIKPYVRMTRRGKWTNPQAQEYLANQQEIAWQIKDQMSEKDWEMLPEKTPLSVSLEFVQPKALHRCDLDNLQKAVIDAAQGIVFKNDCWIDSYNGVSRRLGGRYLTILQIGVNNEY